MAALGVVHPAGHPWMDAPRQNAGCLGLPGAGHCLTASYLSGCNRTWQIGVYVWTAERNIWQCQGLHALHTQTNPAAMLLTVPPQEGSGYRAESAAGASAGPWVGAAVARHCRGGPACTAVAPSTIRHLYGASASVRGKCCPDLINTKIDQYHYCTSELPPQEVTREDSRVHIRGRRGVRWWCDS